MSEVVWPDKFMETVVPSLEEFEDMPAAGLSIVKRGLMKITKNNITSQVHNLLFPYNFSYYKKFFKKTNVVEVGKCKPVVASVS